MVVSQASTVIWHDLECGAYTADLALWRELAAPAGSGLDAQPLLDIGAGSGRVALDLAARGYRVTALDIDPKLLDALHTRATDAHTPVETVCADARAFELRRRHFVVCLAPMQTVQLLGGADGRLSFLRQVHRHLRPGGLLACAIVSDIEPFDCAAGDLGPSPETTHVDGVRYLSSATRVHVDAQRVRIERERSILGAEQAGRATPAPEHNVIELDRLTATQLASEGRQAGLTPAGTRSIPATEEHVGSEVVLLRA